VTRSQKDLGALFARDKRSLDAPLFGSSSLTGVSNQSVRVFFVNKNKQLTGGIGDAPKLSYHWVKEDTCRKDRGA
jgi:hypothetical protein